VILTMISAIPILKKSGANTPHGSFSKWKTNEQQELIEGLLSSEGVGFLVGVPDSGKSTLGLKIATAIAKGDREVLNLLLHTNHQRVLIVRTEDQEVATKFVLKKILKGEDVVTKEALSRIDFVFTGMLSPDEILSKVRAKLKKHRYDLVLLDAYGDLFSRKDSNSNSETRKFLAPYYALASQYHCLLLFTHHLNKSGYDEKPAQRYIQGASALTQKSRICIQLFKAKDEPNKRYLCVLKGNYLSSQYKDNAIQLHFDDCIFKPTGVIKSIEEFGQKPEEASGKSGGGKPDGDKKRKAFESNRNYDELFDPGESLLHYEELVERGMEFWDKSESAIKRDIRQRLASGHLKRNEEGLYFSTQHLLEDMIPDDGLDPDQRTVVDLAPATFGNQAPAGSGPEMPAPDSAMPDAQTSNNLDAVSGIAIEANASGTTEAEANPAIEPDDGNALPSSIE